jgi:hypothetical protein
MLQFPWYIAHNLRVRYILAVFLLAGCTSLSVADDPNVSRDSIQVVDNGVFGTRTTLAPDVAGFDQILPQEKKIFVECVFEAKDDPLNSELGKSECEKEAGRLLLSKSFILISAADGGSERWLFRFEDKRERAGGGSLASPFDKSNKQQMWGTLTRFKPGAPKPYSHVVASGISQFQRGAWQPAPSRPSSPDSLLVILIKSLILKAVADPNAGDGEIEN